MRDDMSVEVRLRTPWEAADLGCVLLRSQARTVFPVMMILVLPPALALAFALRNTPWLTPLLFWWLKPLFDRPVLHVLAKATFGEAPGILETLRRIPIQCRRGLAAQLFWRRPDLERSLLQPVWQLEDPSGAAFRARRKVLVGRERAQAQLLTAVCFLFQALVCAMAIALLGYLWPVGDSNILESVFGRGHRIPLLDGFLWFLPTLAMIAVEPFYVAAGFGLYLNRRVQLEGWDLELAFRRIGERARSARGLGMLLLALLALAPLRLQAAPAPKEAIQEVMNSPEFATTREGWTLRARNPRAPEAQKPPPPWLLNVSALVGTVLKWLIPIALVSLLAAYIWRSRAAILSATGRLQPLPVPDQLFGLDIRPAALPRNIPLAAQELWDGGDPRAALALLYRGSLAHLVQSRGEPLGPGSTEGDCLDRARTALPEAGGLYFARLMDAWRSLAYGGKPAAPGDRELCAQWGQHFTGGLA